jgi:peroxiredoxin
MTRIFTLVPLALLGPWCMGQQLQPPSQALRAGCSSEDAQLGNIGPDDAVEVNQALAGGEQTCYRVTLTRSGQSVTGYVQGEALPVVAAFLREQQKYRDASFEAQDRLDRERARQEAVARAKAPASGPNSQPSAKLSPDMPASFEEFGGRDITGKSVSLSGVGGRVILVTFWSPRSASSKGQLLTVLPLYNQYKRAGLRAIGIGEDSNPARLAQALDDISLGWPQLPDRTGMAQRYGVNPAKGGTLVLDASHHILAAGLTPAELEKKVRELLAAR